MKPFSSTFCIMSKILPRGYEICIRMNPEEASSLPLTCDWSLGVEPRQPLACLGVRVKGHAGIPDLCMLAGGSLRAECNVGLSVWPPPLCMTTLFHHEAVT